MELEEVLERADILEYVSQYTDLEEKNGEWWGLSPFKEENTPSFSVDPEKGLFYDFSSGAGGNVISFIMEREQCNFPRALTILKNYLGVTDDAPVASTRLLSTKIAKQYKHKTAILKPSSASILPANYMERYERNPEKLKVWVNEGISEKSMERFSVRYDGFSNRIVFPIRNYNGDIINISGRTLDPDYKEKKLRKYTYFKELGTLDTLYGFSDNRADIEEKREVIIFEGSKSVMIADTWGVGNTCCLLTSHLNPQQLMFLIKLGVRVVFALDKDVDIKQDKNIEKLKRYVKIEYLYDKDNLLEPKMAPVDAGFEVWNSLYERRRALN